MLALLLEKHRKLIGFTLFGCLSGSIYAVILVVSVDILGFPPFFGSVIAFALGVPVSYFGNRWVSYRSNNTLAPEALRFLIVQLISLMLTSALVHLMADRFTIPTYIAVIIAFIVAPIISLILFELWVYRRRPSVDSCSHSHSKLSQN